MATWRCPHCRTVQVDSLSCFLCGRSATSCGTCVSFRQSVVGGIGYCALDRHREPLTGEERRICWSGSDEPPTDSIFDLPGGAAAKRGLYVLNPARAIRPRPLTGG
jgi:hypothetical protein